MEINDLELFAVGIPRTDVDSPSRRLLVALSAGDGIVGWGESPLRWRVDELPARRDLLLNFLTTHSIFDVSTLAAIEPSDDPLLTCALNTALWDLIGKASGQPLHNLWGGIYRQHLPLAVRLPSGDVKRTANVARELAEHGFHAQVVDAVDDIDATLTTLQAIQLATGRAEVCVDAGLRFDMTSARQLCSRLHQAGAKLVIDPLAEVGATALMRLSRQTLAPLGASRRLDNPSDVLDAARGGASSLMLNMYQQGGPSGVMQSAAIAGAARLSAAIAVEGSVGVATAAMLQLAAAVPALSGQHLSDYAQLADDILQQPLAIDNGLLSVPQGTGLGVEVDRVKIEKYRLT